MEEKLTILSPFLGCALYTRFYGNSYLQDSGRSHYNNWTIYISYLPPEFGLGCCFATVLKDQDILGPGLPSLLPACSLLAAAFLEIICEIKIITSNTYFNCYSVQSGATGCTLWSNLTNDKYSYTISILGPALLWNLIYQLFWIYWHKSAYFWSEQR